MNQPVIDTSFVLVDGVGDWLMRNALAGVDVADIFSGLCERLSAAGLPLKRVHLTFSVLHPLYRASGFTWRRGAGITAHNTKHSQGSMPEAFAKSPYYYLLSNDLEHLRRRIEPATAGEFPILEDLKAEGMTDYLAFVHKFDTSSSQGMMGSWSTDRPEGFSESALSALLRLQSQLAVAIKMSVLGRLADNMLSTYLGSEAGKRVLSGQVKRGDTETIRAALVVADMRNSTEVADLHGRQVFFDTLNAFFDSAAAPFNRNGGQILSFLGDGFLAIYPCERNKQSSGTACRAAVAAARSATYRMASLNRDRAGRQLWEIDFGIGLHVGNVIFGNVGLADRLTFSTFGAAVNEAQRLESLTKKFPSKTIASDAFVGYCGGDWNLLGTEALPGIEQPVKVYAPLLAHPDSMAGELMQASEDPGLSDAEQVMMLHRASRKVAKKAVR